LARSRGRKRPAGPLSILLVEGETELLFYDRVKALCLRPANRITIEHIGGLYNVNKKILGKLTSKYEDQMVRAYCCLDRESRHAQTPGFDLELIRNELRARNVTNVLSVDKVIATQMIESWFFYDIVGVYRYLKAPKTRRKGKAYNPPEKCRETDLKALFRKHGKNYQEGRRAKPFIDQLDIAKIAADCKALKEGIARVNKQARDTTSHLFR